jgi:nucleotide-binding universal stress UspA family protein
MLMKKILIPVDFSDNSRNAVHYAIELFRGAKEDVRFTLFNAYKVYSSTGMFISVEKYMQEDAEEEMRLLLANCQESLPQHIQVEGKCVRGDVIPTICHVADKQDYDMVLMGTKGASGLKEVFLGSVASGVIKQAQTPVLVIPGDYHYEKPERILLAIDGKGLSGEEITRSVRMIATFHKSEIFILHIAEPDEEPRKVDPVKDLFLPDHPYTFVQFPGYDINASINASVHTENAQMLCMVRRKRSLLEKLFHTSTTTKEVFNSPVPFLVLHD